MAKPCTTASPRGWPVAEGPLAGIWPPGRLELAEWRDLLEALAADAEKLIGCPGTLQQSCTLALRWFGLCWPAMSPEVIAASCRASLQLGDPPGVVAALPLGDQLQEIAERMAEIYERAQSDPSALAVEVLPPVLLAAPGVLPEQAPYKPTGRRKRNPEPLQVIRQEARALAAAEAEALVPSAPLAELEAPEDAPTAADVRGEPETEPQQLEQQPQPEETAPVPPGWGEPEPIAPQAQGQGQPLDLSPAEVMPPGWVDVVAVAAAVGASIGAVQRAKKSGRLLEGRHWQMAPPGLKLPGARKPLRTIWHLASCVEILGAAAASDRLDPEQLRRELRQKLRERGRQRRERFELATQALAEIQGRQQQPAAREPAAADALDVGESVAAPEVLAGAVAQALQQLGITSPPPVSANGHHQPMSRCWAD